MELCIEPLICALHEKFETKYADSEVFISVALSRITKKRHFIESAFYRIRRFINRLASLETKRLDLEQQFNKVLTNWNGAEGNMESPRFQING